MISGITLMDFYDRYSLKEFFVRRFNKTVIPFLAWSLIILAGKVATHRIPASEINARYIYQAITGTTIVDYYWFFSSLFVIYLSIPLFAAVEKDKRKEVFTYLVVAGFLLNILAPFINGVFELDLNTPLAVIVDMNVLIWVPLGWLLHNTQFSKWQKAVIYCVALFGLRMHIVGTYVLSMRTGMIDGTFKGYENVPSVLYAVGVFVLLKDIGTKVMESRARGFFSFLGSYTYPIFLTQFIFLKLIVQRPFVNPTSLVYRLGGPYVIIPMIIVMTAVLRKIPIVKKIVP